MVSHALERAVGAAAEDDVEAPSLNPDLFLRK